MAILQPGLLIVHTGKQYQTKSQVFGSSCHRQASCLESPSLNIITDGYWAHTRYTLQDAVGFSGDRQLSFDHTT